MILTPEQAYKKPLFILMGTLLVIGLGYFLLPGIKIDMAPTATVSPTPIQNQSTGNPEVIVQNLNIPWEVVFLPAQEMLITERAGNLVKISSNGLPGQGQRTVIPVPEVQHSGEGGLLGMALHPNFSSNRYIYLYLTTRAGQGTTNRVERYEFRDDKLTNKKIIIQNIPGASNHDGGRIKFGPDGLLYIGTGDAGNEDNAQNTASLAGKILRVHDDGSVPTDNPFKNAVYSYGHRNVQGLAWDDQGRLWATEHGRSGLQSGYDELNLIKKGANYGWPEIQGDETRSGMEKPIINSGPNKTWAPSGALFKDNKIYFAGLRGEALYEATISNDKVTAFTEHFTGQYGRLRTVTADLNGVIHILTNNTDGRGNPKSNDDKLIKVLKFE